MTERGRRRTDRHPPRAASELRRAPRQRPPRRHSGRRPGRSPGGRGTPTTASSDRGIIHAHARSAGRGCSSTATEVMMPNAPPDPMSRAPIDGPTLCLRRVVSSSTTLQRSSASTARTPSTARRMSPCRSMRAPPVFVAAMPPRVGSAARSIGRQRPWRSAAWFSSDRRTPASTTAVRSATSMTGSRCRRTSDSTTAPLPAGGVDAPTRPVLAPWGTSRTRCRRAQPTTVRTSSVSAGRTTARASPGSPRHGTTWPAISSGSVRTAAAPSVAVSSSRASRDDIGPLSSRRSLRCDP